MRYIYKGTFCEYLRRNNPLGYFDLNKRNISGGSEYANAANGDTDDRG